MVGNFFVFNSLNFFSLIILSLLFVHATYYFKREQEIIWKKVLLFAVLAQSLDIITWYIATLTGDTAIVLSYVFNILLFTASTALAVHIALFFQNSIEFNSRLTKYLKKAFNYLILLNFTLLVLSVPFGFIFEIDVSNNYIRGGFYAVMATIVLLPPVIILARLLLKHFSSFNKMLKENKRLAVLIAGNIIIISGLLFLQGLRNTEVTIIFSVITISILIMHMMLISRVITSDHLTSLQNKLGLELNLSRLPKVFEEYLAVVFFDLDKFKEANDEFGHKEGDAVLRNFAQIIRRQAKNKDIVARIGGDEFLSVLTTNNLKEVDIMIDAVIKEVEVYNSKNPVIKIIFSYGIVINQPNEPYIMQNLIEEADKKMYEHKNSKK